MRACDRSFGATVWIFPETSVAEDPNAAVEFRSLGLRGSGLSKECDGRSSTTKETESECQ